MDVITYPWEMMRNAKILIHFFFKVLYVKGQIISAFRYHMESEKSVIDKQSLDGGHQYGEVIARLL